MDDDIPVIVIDNGSYTIRTGIAGDVDPMSAFRTVVGRPRYPSLLKEMNMKESYIGDEALELRNKLTLNNPIEKGNIIDFNDIKEIWKYSCEELRMDIEEHPILMTEKDFNSKKNREKTTQVLFEDLNVPRMFLASQSILCFFCCGRGSGTSVYSGEGSTFVCSFLENERISDTFKEIPIGGIDINQYLMKLMTERGYPFTTEKEHEMIRFLKEDICYVSESFDDEFEWYNESDNDNKYELLDGTTIYIGKELIQSPEILFQPSLIDYCHDGIHEIIHQSIQNCDEDIREQLYKNIVLSGGSTMFNGMKERLQNEISSMTQNEVKVISNPERNIATWIGGSILGSLSCFEYNSIRKEEYNEYKSTIVHKKCNL